MMQHVTYLLCNYLLKHAKMPSNMVPKTTLKSREEEGGSKVNDSLHWILYENNLPKYSTPQFDQCQGSKGLFHLWHESGTCHPTIDMQNTTQRGTEPPSVVDLILYI